MSMSHSADREKDRSRSAEQVWSLFIEFIIMEEVVVE